MSQLDAPTYALPEPTRGAWRWPHLQRVWERWLRLWGFAISGWVVGFSGVWLVQMQVSEDHAHVAQTVEQLQQQLAALPQSLLDDPTKSISIDGKAVLASLPGQAQQGQIWVNLQQVLAKGGLSLLSLRPLPPTLAVGSGLPSQTVAVRVLGRFDDWANVWGAFTQAGTVCTIDRISISATANPAEVQIDAVLRIWLRPGDADLHVQPESESAWEKLMLSLPWPRVRSGAVLFAQSQGVSLGADAPRLNELVETSAANVAGVSAAAAAVAAAADPLPEDPRQWPLARVRLAGLWQQGTDRQAILSAGSHWVRVSPGQRVTQEGHTVAAISDVGVSLRLDKGPLLPLTWEERRDETKGGAKK